MRSVYLLIFALGTFSYPGLSNSQELDFEAAKVTINALRDPDWSSYRDAYHFHKKYEKYEGAKNLIEVDYFLEPKRADVSLTNLKLKILGDTANIEVPIDEYGRAKIPMSEIAFQEDAQMILNRKKGSFRFRKEVRIKAVVSGHYSLNYLKEACDQRLTFSAYAFERTAIARCLGVGFTNRSNNKIAPEIYFENEIGDRTLLMSANGISSVIFGELPLVGKIVVKEPNVSIGMIVDH